MKRVFLVSAISAAFTVSGPAALAESMDSLAEAPVVVAAASAVEGSGGQRTAPERRASRNPSERMEARLAYVRTALKITDAQQAQWDNFANVLRRHASDMSQRIEKFRAQGAQRPDRTNMTAIERLERTQQRMAARAERLNEVITAAKPLYATLSPEQQTIANEMLSRQGQRGQRGHRQHHRGMHRGA